MLPALAAMFAMNFIGGIAGSGRANVAAIQQTTQAEAQAEDAWLGNAADNKVIAQANLQNTIRTAYRTGILNIQRGQAKKKTAELGINLGKQRLAALGQLTANAAAAGSIGSSVDAVASDALMQAEQADASIVEDSRITQTNLDTQLADILQAGQDALRDPARVNVRKAGNPSQIGTKEVLMNSLISTGTAYASAQMTLGLGKG